DDSVIPQMEKEEEETREILLPNWQGSGSHGITIDQTDDGVFVKRVQQNSPAAKMGVVKEGDQIVSATVYFDNLQSGEVAQLLNSMGHHTVGLRLQRKGDKSPLPGQSWTHDVFAASSPEVVLVSDRRRRRVEGRRKHLGGNQGLCFQSGDDEEYRRIYATKIKPRLKSEEVLEAECGGTQSRTITVTRKVTAYTVDVSRHDGTKDVEVLGPDFKIRIPTQELKTELGKAGTTVSGMPTVGVDLRTRMDPQLPESQVPAGETGKSVTTEMAGRDVSGTTSLSLPGIEANGQMGNLDAGFHVKGPRLDGKGRVSGTDVHMGGTLSCADGSAPRLQGDIKAPGVNVSLPPIENPAIDVGKIKIPVLKMPKFGFPTVGSDAQTPQVGADVPTSKPQAPRADVPPSSIRVAGPEVSAPSVKGPKVDVGLKGAAKVPTPELEVPGVGVKGPSVELPASDAEIHNGKGILKMPHLTFPKFAALDSQGEGAFGEMVLPKGEVAPAAPHVGVPDVAIKGEWKGPKFKKVETPQISLSDVNLNLKGPQTKGDVGVPIPTVEGDVKGLGSKGLKMDVKAPGVAFEGPGGCLKGPSVSAPEMDVHAKGLKVKGEVDVSVPKMGGSLKGPQLDVKGPKLGMDTPDVDVKGPRVTMPEVHVKTPQISLPDIDLNLKGPKVKGDLDVSAPKLEGDLKAPGLDIKGPKVDLGAPDVDIHGPEGKLKMPKLKMPKFGVPGLKGEGIDVTLPKGEVDISAPKVDIDVPSVDIEGPEGKLKGPKVSMPDVDLNLKGPKVSVPDVDLNLKGPKLKGDLDVSIPVVGADLKGPELE
ncbi:AHNK protein, partial [Glareola pratincola]|nr:AHNK protein [Glareola pratincola]